MNQRNPPNNNFPLFAPPVPQQFGNAPGQDPNGGYLHQRATADSLKYLQGLNEQPLGSDPMGIQRNAAMQSYQNTATDPMGFNTMMQAIKEAAPGGIRTPSAHGDPMHGLPNAPFSAPSTMWQGGQSSAVNGNMYQPAVNGLQQNKPRNPFQVGH